MQSFARVIAEPNQGCWFAWFSDEPHCVSRGDDWAHALAVLIDVHGSPTLSWENISVVDEMMSEEHAEFLIPYRLPRITPGVESWN